MTEGIVRKVCCPECGTVQLINEKDISDGDDWLPCVLPTGFEWSLPSGRIVPVVGPNIYIDAIGDKYSRDSYMLKYGLDPEIAYQKMRDRIKKR